MECCALSKLYCVGEDEVLPMSCNNDDVRVMWREVLRMFALFDFNLGTSHTGLCA
jgi:hypothetical protein